MKKLLIGLLISCSCLGVSCNIPNSISSPQNDSHNYNSNVEDFYLDQNKKNDIQPYIDAKDYLQEELDDTEYNFYISLNKDTKTITITINEGDTSVSTLRNLGIDDETIIEETKMEELYSAAQNFGLVITNELTELYDVPDLNIEICVKISSGDGHDDFGPFTLSFTLLKKSCWSKLSSSRILYPSTSSSSATLQKCPSFLRLSVSSPQLSIIILYISIPPALYDNKSLNYFFKSYFIP